jgi:hypothetical protein
MVRITANLYEEAYDYIRQDSAHGNCVMLVAADVDSLCAALMLQVKKRKKRKRKNKHILLPFAHD